MIIKRVMNFQISSQTKFWFKAFSRFSLFNSLKLIAFCLCKLEAFYSWIQGDRSDHFFITSIPWASTWKSYASKQTSFGRNSWEASGLWRQKECNWASCLNMVDWRWAASAAGYGQNLSMSFMCFSMLNLLHFHSHDFSMIFNFFQLPIPSFTHSFDFASLILHFNHQSLFSNFPNEGCSVLGLSSTVSFFFFLIFKLKPTRLLDIVVWPQPYLFLSKTTTT